MNVRFLLILLTATILSLHCSDDSGDPLSVQGEGAFRYLRTPDSAFTALPGFDYTPRYATVSPGDLRMHYADEGPPDGRIILLMHGNPAWSALYRNMAPALLDAGYRIIAPDLIGFGRSDKPVSRPAHTYANHVAWITDFITQRHSTSSPTGAGIGLITPQISSIPYCQPFVRSEYSLRRANSAAGPLQAQSGSETTHAA